MTQNTDTNWRERFTSDVRMTPSYDHRDSVDPLMRNRGCGSARLHFILRGEGVAVSLAVHTDWMANPLEVPYIRVKNTPAPWPRRDQVGIDAPSFRSTRSPNGAGVYLHSATQVKDWWLGPDACDILGGQCYGDVGYLISDEALRIFVSQGSDVGFQFLADTLDAWMAPEVENAEVQR
jgi:hypothetical protein